MRPSIAAPARPDGRTPALVALALAGALLGTAPPATAGAQGWMDRAKQKAKERVDRQVDKQVDRALDKTVDSTAAQITGDAGAPAVPAANRSGGTGAGTAARAAAGGGGAPDALRPGEGAWANYDFKPGERILFADDFTRDEVGDFPQRLQLKQGSMEIVEWQGRRLVRATAPTNSFLVTLPEELPQRYTVEFDYANAHGYGWGGLLIGFDGKDPDHSGTTRVRFNHDNAGIENRELKALKAPGGDLAEKLYRCRIMVDGDYAKVYVNEQRVANVPTAALARTRTLYFTIHVRDAEKYPALIGDIRVAAGGRKLYDAIAEKGRVATQGIYFDTGSDRIRPESTPTLKEIGAMLGDHPELKLAIEGHTDNAGQAASNLALSERRAAAVRQALVAQFGVDEGRLTSKGLGQAKPAAANDTPEGRQQNRRVELVRQ
ncbi:MAG TPA: OmpA family protein [Gemmatirosa sp.]|nr:OmpA family protein [Gemmatirosa sp.]